MKKIFAFSAMALAVCTMAIGLTGCNTYKLESSNNTKWKTKYDISAPVLDGAGGSRESANSEGWYITMDEDFDSKAPEHWGHVENTKRNEAYWDDSMITYGAKDGERSVVKIGSTKENGVAKTSGIFTCEADDKRGKPTFAQAFGYFEVTCSVPKSDGIWAAFWLQTESIGQIGNKGLDGAEIDIFESNFYRRPNNVGSAVHYDGYESKHRSLGAVHDVGTNTYEGYHTYGLKWTPDEYVFYFDGEPTWATDFGGTCRVPAYLMLTCEMRDKGISGPYGDKLGDFTGGDFLIDSVKVYQNKNYEQYIRTAESYR